MSLLSELKNRVSSLAASKLKSGIEQYRTLLARQGNPKPGDVEAMLEVCRDLDIDIDRIEVHAVAVESLAALDAFEKSIRKSSASVSAKQQSYTAIANEVESIIREAKRKLSVAAVELETAHRANERMNAIQSMRERIAIEFAWLLESTGDDAVTPETARQIAEVVATITSEGSLQVQPGETLRSLPGILCGDVPFAT